MLRHCPILIDYDLFSDVQVSESKITLNLYLKLLIKCCKLSNILEVKIYTCVEKTEGFILWQSIYQFVKFMILVKLEVFLDK